MEVRVVGAKVEMGGRADRRVRRAWVRLGFSVIVAIVFVAEDVGEGEAQEKEIRDEVMPSQTCMS